MTDGREATPRLGLVVPSLPAGGRDIGELAQDAEAAGASSFWLTDHLFWHQPTVEVLTALALVAAATERCTIGPCVLQLPLRQPAAVAKATGFLDHLCPGRVVVGVGSGEHRGEYEAAGLGHRYDHRGSLLDKGINELRRCWGESGRYGLSPGRSLPVWVGGRSPRARRRAAALGDGWVPHLCRPEWLHQQYRKLDDDLDAAGRRPDTVSRGVLVAVAVEDAPGCEDPAGWIGRLYAMDPRRGRHVLVQGGAEDVVQELRAFREAGAQELIVMAASDAPVEQFTALLHARG